jgi:hypothetical protein
MQEKLLPISDSSDSALDDSAVLRTFLHKSTQNVVAFRNEFEFLDDGNFFYFILQIKNQPKRFN